jgi:hypothetical protein
VLGPINLLIVDIHGQVGEFRKLGEAPEHGWTEITGIKADVECGYLWHPVEELFEMAIAHPGGSIVKDQRERIHQRTELADKLERPLVSVHKVEGGYMVAMAT